MAESQPAGEAAAEASAATPERNPAPPPSQDAPGAAEAAAADVSFEELLNQASFEDPAALEALTSPAATPVGAAAASSGFEPPSPGAPVPPDAANFKLPNFHQVIQDAQASSIDLLRDVELNVKIELGRSRMLVEDVLKLAEGSVVELDKLAGDPVDVFVNDRLVARGEVLVLNDNFCVRVNEIVAGAKEETV